MVHPLGRRTALVAAAMGLACGARSELSVDGDGSQPASEQAWTCTADGGACDGDAACCSLRCDARRCAPSACQPGDAPVRMVEVGDGRIFGWPALVLAAREVVYLTEAGGVLAVDKRGGEPRLITRTQVGAIPTSAVYADGAIFITTFGPDAPRGDILRVELGDGRIEVMARSEFRPSAIAVDRERIYWTVGNTDVFRVDGMVRSLPRSGGMPRTIARDQRGPWAVATHAGRVYWSNFPDHSGDTNGNVMSAHHDGSDTRVIADGIGQAWHLAVDASHVYYGSDLGTPGKTTLHRAAIDGGASAELSAGHNLVGAMALDDRALYVGIEEGTFGDDFIRRFAKQGGEPSLFTELIGRPNGLAVDYTCVFWSTEDGVWRAPRPPM